MLNTNICSGALAGIGRPWRGQQMPYAGSIGRPRAILMASGNDTASECPMNAAHSELTDQPLHSGFISIISIQEKLSLCLFNAITRMSWTTWSYTSEQEIGASRAGYCFKLTYRYIVLVSGGFPARFPEINMACPWEAAHPRRRAADVRERPRPYIRYKHTHFGPPIPDC